MDIDRLRYFRTIVESGGLTQAAKLLHITPGALSKAVRQLESEAGQSLFSRVGRSLVLTAVGRSLYGASERVLDEYQRMWDAISGVGASVGQLRLGSFEIFTTYFLGGLVTDELAGIDIMVLELDVSELGRAVLDHQIDVGLTYVPYPEPGLAFEPVARMEFGIYARKGAFDRLPFRKIPFAIPTRPVRHSPRNLLRLDSWPAGAPARRIRYRFGLLESALEMARRGSCAVFIPAAIAALHNQTVLAKHRLVRIPNPRPMKPVQQTVYLVTRVGGRKDEPIERLVTGVRRLCG